VRLDEDAVEAAKQLAHEKMKCTSQMTMLSRLYGECEDDPFDQDSFMEFMAQMTDKKWGPRSVLQHMEVRDRFRHDVDVQKQRLAKYEGLSEKMRLKLERARARVAEWENELRTAQLSLGQVAEEIHSQRTPCIDGADHIKIDQARVNALTEDQTAVLIGFEAFEFDEALFGTTRCLILLELGFFEHRVTRTQAVDPKSLNFDTTFFYACPNDFQLRHYIQAGLIAVELHTVRGLMDEQIAVGRIDLRPFLEEKLAFTSRMTMEKDGESVGEVSYEAMLLRPLRP
jgi:hypothetical protein